MLNGVVIVSVICTSGLKYFSTRKIYEEGSRRRLSKYIGTLAVSNEGVDKLLFSLATPKTE